MTQVQVATIDAYVLRRAPSGIEVLVLHRAPGVRCSGAWEVVHGRIEGDERPEDAALREVVEETGLTPERLYNVRCHAFYLPSRELVNIAVVFAAFVESTGAIHCGEEHDASEWLSLEAAAGRLSWPRARDILRDIAQLLRDGDAGPLEDVLRIR